MYWLTILLFASVLVIVYMARSVLAIFCLSILFAYLIDPVVSFLDRHSLLRRKARGVHIAEAYLGVLILVAGTIYVLTLKQAAGRVCSCAFQLGEKVELNRISSSTRK